MPGSSWARDQTYATATTWAAAVMPQTSLIAPQGNSEIFIIIIIIIIIQP